jgi:hypothetical protein
LAKNLVILPFETSLTEEELMAYGNSTLPAFQGYYSTTQVLDKDVGTQLISEDTYAPDALFGTPNFGVYAIPGKGILRDFGAKIDYNSHGLIITDRILSYAGFMAGGCADSRNKTTLVTRSDILKCSEKDDLERILSRTRGIIIHELGHLFGLAHHFTRLAPDYRKYCPMITRNRGSRGLNSSKGVARYHDSRADVFCEDCNAKIMALLEK